VCHIVRIEQQTHRMEINNSNSNRGRRKKKKGRTGGKPAATSSTARSTSSVVTSTTFKRKRGDEEDVTADDGSNDDLRSSSKAGSTITTTTTTEMKRSSFVGDDGGIDDSSSLPLSSSVKQQRQHNTMTEENEVVVKKSETDTTTSPSNNSSIAPPHSSSTPSNPGAADNNASSSITTTTTTRPNNDDDFDFVTNVLDHCETPCTAYEDLHKFLNLLGDTKKIRPTKLRIWDPYYCDGSMKRIFTDMGFTNIIHEKNRDFYKRIQEDDIPDHDVLITNPPYSDDHIQKLLDFVVNVQIPNGRPCCLLLPNWVSRQPDYVERFAKPITSKSELFYLSPIEAYTYQMPSWVKTNDRPDHVGESGSTTPYLSSWYIVPPPAGGDSTTTTMSRRKPFVERMDSKRQDPKRWVVAKTVKGLKWKINKLKKEKGGKKK
jgi:hypothetical protein